MQRSRIAMGTFEQDGGCCGDFERLVGSNLVLQILAKLSAIDLFRAKCVCKSWNDAVGSSEFQSLHKDEIWDMVHDMKKDEVWAVLDVRNKSEICKKLWCPSRSISKGLTNMPFMPPTGFEQVCSSNGLVCGRLSKHPYKIELVVGNPLTNAWKKLPPVKITIPHLTHYFEMKRDPVSGCYTILVVAEACLRYESNLGVWQEVCRPEYLARVVFSNFSSYRQAYLNYKDEHIIVHFQAPDGAINVWKFDETSSARVSTKMFKDLIPRYWNYRSFQLVGDMIIISVIHVDHLTPIIIAYNLLHSTWTCFGKEDDNEYPDHQSVELCYAFLPSLKAKP